MSWSQLSAVGWDGSMAKNKWVKERGAGIIDGSRELLSRPISTNGSHAVSLDDRYADLVRFECESCGREQSLGQIRKRSGTCAKCERSTWSMFTEYHERGLHGGPMPWLLFY